MYTPEKQNFKASKGMWNIAVAQIVLVYLYGYQEVAVKKWETKASELTVLNKT